MTVYVRGYTRTYRGRRVRIVPFVRKYPRGRRVRVRSYQRSR